MTSSHTLTFTSSPKNLGLIKPCDPFESQVNRWRISETLTPHPHDDLRAKGVGEYRMILQKPVTTQDEVWEAHKEARTLAKELDIAWCYTCGKPYSARELRWESVESPDGWQGNLREVERDIQRESGLGFAAEMQIVNRHWAYLETLPLQKTLETRQVTAAAPSPIRELIELHIQSQKVADGNLFLLAKALEIVGAHASGDHSRAKRNARIERRMKNMGVDAFLTKGVDWLFEMANERFDVRHAWDKDAVGVALHRRMADQERKDFVYNADLVIRAFICRRLRIPVPLIGAKGTTPPKTGQWNNGVLEFDT